MTIVADTNAFLAVALDEPDKVRIIELSSGHNLAAPQVLPFEIGNALIAMTRRGSLTPEEVLSCWETVQAITVALHPVEMRSALNLAARFGIYAYDAYFLECALSLRAPILTLDKQMKRVARDLCITVLE